MISLINANSLQISLKSGSVQCVVTSPPYWGLRDYGVDGQLGQEQTPDEYVAHLVDVFREVWRVLRDDGTLWLNLGDSYASAWACGRPSKIGAGAPTAAQRQKRIPRGKGNRWGGGNVSAPNLKEKDLCGIPWAVAFALRADGWYLRRDIVWSKPNPMPEPVTDRPSTSHEYIFLLTKSAKYFYDHEAIKEPGVMRDMERPESHLDGNNYLVESKGQTKTGKSFGVGQATRNRRSVWTINTYSYTGAHFATWPPALVEPMIKAGTSPQACEHCGAPWARTLQDGELISTDGTADDYRPTKTSDDPRIKGRSEGWTPNHYIERITVGWKPTCKCPDNAGTGLCIVLDPFVGSGTSLLVARKLGRSGIGLDLSFSYLRNEARERLSFTALDEWENGAPIDDTTYSDLPMFQEQPNE